ncbi:M1 family metallopeptidase [Altererythrobacter sp. ZODW24]|uniref:M1 family metallopeptidase n=1 Tax=Altererythrobacter sp. ZODW24 TaxID=2185142 RepID=UPI000DF7AE40|nr:M1 family metallopeptidase [Altererythrobacter sp. ZODW24]
MRSAFIAAATASLLAGCATLPASDNSAPVAAAPAEATIGLTTRPLPASTNTDLPRIARPLHYTITIVPDAANLRFSGSSSVDIEVFEETDVVTMHAVELDIQSASLIDLSTGESEPLAVYYDADKQTATFNAGLSFPRGKYRIDTVYTGIINTQANGLFALDYPDKIDGSDRRGLFTQFEAPDARRFAPMFDEPSYKATFDLSAIVPSAQMALSNMPVVKETDLGDGTKRVTFGTSPQMSSYLLFFGLGDFERASKMASDGTEVGIVAPIGSGDQKDYALNEMAPLMGYFNEYFGVDYPLPKLDNIAGPGSSQFFGAMENWGAIFTFERILLVDPSITSASAKQRLSATQAHEVAHQWFGNIVTMAWWDDLWLNEGFASWMETKATDHFHPEWYPKLSRVGGREAAMNLDAFVTTHPVVQEIRTVEETSQAFDAIAYQKGEAVISMLEAYAGEDVWREGIRAYMKQHAYGNTVSNDLWVSVENAGATGLAAIARDFTLQPGIPMVEIGDAICEGGKTTFSVKQSEFSRDRMKEVGETPQSWKVPMLVAIGNGAPTRQVLEGSASLTLDGCGPVNANAGQLGYYRSRYTPGNLDGLEASLATLAPIDQLGLMRDQLELSETGYQPMGPALDLVMAIPADTNAVVASSTVGQLGSYYDFLDDEAAKAKMAKLASSKWGPRLKQLGFAPNDNEPLADSNLRSRLISNLGGMGDPGITAEGRRLFAALAEDERAMDGPLKTTWLNIVAGNATRGEWDRMAKIAASSKSTVEKQTYYRLLGRTENEELAKAALELALTDVPGKTNSAGMISSVAGSHSEMAFDFYLANRDKVDALVDDSGRSRFVARLFFGAESPEMLTKLEAFAEELPADERRPVDRVITVLRERFAKSPRIRGEVNDWLAQQSN